MSYPDDDDHDTHEDYLDRQEEHERRGDLTIPELLAIDPALPCGPLPEVTPQDCDEQGLCRGCRRKGEDHLTGHFVPSALRPPEYLEVPDAT